MTICNFCGKSGSKKFPVYHDRTSNINICVECALRIHQEILEDAKRNPNTKNILLKFQTKGMEKDKKLPTPKDLKSYMDAYVIGQDEGKKALAVAVYNHYKRINLNIEKSNILMVGPTGSGKTLLVKTIAQKLQVPFVVIDATTLTPTGYIGNDVESILARLYNEANENMEKAQRGIVFLDEFDKIGKQSKSDPMGQRGLLSEGVQQALLKLMEGKVVTFTIPDRYPGERKILQMDTKNILFICSGAFASSSISKKTIGFGAEICQVEEDLGIIPELMGRLPVCVRLKELNVEELVQILYKPKNSVVSQYCKLLALDGVNLFYTDQALEEIAKKAIAKGTGARGLRSIMEDVMEDIMYNVPSMDINKCVITKNVILGKKDPIYEKEEEKAETKKAEQNVVSRKETISVSVHG